jgi:hypothetical protein
MMIGGMLSLSDRRLRIGAPNRAKAKAARKPWGCGLMPEQVMMARLLLLVLAFAGLGGGGQSR